MHLNLLFAVPDIATDTMMRSVLAAALQLVELDVDAATVFDGKQLAQRLESTHDDILLLDWGIADAGTPALVQSLLQNHPHLRVVALLPENQRQYRCMVWNAGACNGIPKEYMDQEWLATVLCIMHRAMEREARLLQRFESMRSAHASQGVIHG